jgi:hypothetical protein
MVKKPGLKERAPTAGRIVDKIFRFIDTFLSGALSG